jgi:nitrile hydratase
MHDDHHHPIPHTAVEARVDALEALLIEKGILDPAAIDAIVEYYEHDVGPMNGAKVVARAWTDPDYKSRLLANATAAIAELGFGGPEGEHMVVVENTPEAHNVVVCTLCSCYPWPVLTATELRAKSAPYRSRPGEPPSRARRNGLRRATTSRSGWDSSAEIRYLHPDAARRHPASLTKRSSPRSSLAIPTIGVAPANHPGGRRWTRRAVDPVPTDARLRRRGDDALAIAILLGERAGCRWDDFRRISSMRSNRCPTAPTGTACRSTRHFDAGADLNEAAAIQGGERGREPWFPAFAGEGVDATPALGMRSSI